MLLYYYCSMCYYTMLLYSSMYVMYYIVVCCMLCMYTHMLHCSVAYVLLLLCVSTVVCMYVCVCSYCCMLVLLLRASVSLYVCASIAYCVSVYWLCCPWQGVLARSCSRCHSALFSRCLLTACLPCLCTLTTVHTLQAHPLFLSASHML